LILKGKQINSELRLQAPKVDALDKALCGQ
jgi:hypothetical protein